MKKSVAVAIMLALVVSMGGPVFAQSMEEPGSPQIKNIKTGVTNVESGWVEYMDRTGQEAAKGRTTGEQLVGVVAGSAIGIRKGIHRIGAGAIDLLTFWIPKKRPLITPEKHRLAPE